MHTHIHTHTAPATHPHTQIHPNCLHIHSATHTHTTREPMSSCHCTGPECLSWPWGRSSHPQARSDTSLQGFHTSGQPVLPPAPSCLPQALKTPPWVASGQRHGDPTTSGDRRASPTLSDKGHHARTCLPSLGHSVGQPHIHNHTDTHTHTHTITQTHTHIHNHTDTHT